MAIAEASPTPNHTSITRRLTGADRDTGADQPFLLARCKYVASMTEFPIVSGSSGAEGSAAHGLEVGESFL